MTNVLIICIKHACCNSIKLKVSKTIVMSITLVRYFQTDEYKNQTDFMTDIVNTFTVGPDDVQFGAVTFSSSARIEFDLQQHADKESVVADIKSWIRVRK